MQPGNRASKKQECSLLPIRLRAVGILSGSSPARRRIGARGRSLIDDLLDAVGHGQNLWIPRPGLVGPVLLCQRTLASTLPTTQSTSLTRDNNSRIVSSSSLIDQVGSYSR